MTVIALFVVGMLQGAEPWIGKWRVVSAKIHYDNPYRITISNHPEGLRLLPGWSANGEPVPRTLRRVDRTTVESTSQSGGTVQRYALSADGRVLTQSGKSSSGEEQTSIFDRVGDVPRDSDSMLGVWEYNDEKSIIWRARLRTYESEADGRLRFTGGQLKYVAAFDGKDHPTDISGLTIGLRRIDDHSFEENFKEGGKPASVRSVAVSSDGKEMTFTHTGTFFGAPGRRVVVFRKE